MPIEIEYNAIVKTLEDPNNQEMAKVIEEYLSYLCSQYRFSKNRERLIKIGTYEILRRVNEQSIMIDGRNNQQDNNDIPF